MNEMYVNTQVTKNAEGQVAVQAFTFATEKEAKANHHYFMSSSYATVGLVYICGMIHDANGDYVLKPEFWYAPQTEETAE